MELFEVGDFEVIVLPRHKVSNEESIFPKSMEVPLSRQSLELVATLSLFAKF